MANLSVTTTADQQGLDKLIAAANRANRTLDRLVATADKNTQATKKMSRSFKGAALLGAVASVALDKLADAAIAAAKAIIGGLVKGFRFMLTEATKFNRAIGELSTLLRGRVGTEMNRFRTNSMEIANIFGAMPEDSVRGFYNAVSAGATTATAAMNVMTAAGALSVGGLANIGDSAKGIVSILRAFGEVEGEFGNAGRLADIFFVTMQKGLTTVPELVENLGKVAGNARLAGLSMEEMGAAIAAITAKGIKTEMAVVGLNNALKLFIKPSKEAIAAAQAHNISLERLSSGGFADFLAKLRDLEQNHKDAFGALIPDIRGQRAMLALLADESNAYIDTMDAMVNKNGAAVESMEKVSNTAAFQIQRFHALRAGMAAAFGEVILKSPAVLGAMKGVNAALMFVTQEVLKLTNATNYSSESWEIWTRNAMANVLSAIGRTIAAVGRLVIAMDIWWRASAQLVWWTETLIEVLVVLSGPVGIALVASYEAGKLAVSALAASHAKASTEFGQAGETLMQMGRNIDTAADRLRDFKTSSTGIDIVKQRFLDMAAAANAATRSTSRAVAAGGGSKTGTGKGTSGGVSLTSKQVNKALHGISLTSAHTNPLFGPKAIKKEEKEINELLRMRNQLLRENAAAAAQFIGPVLQGLGQMIMQGASFKEVLSGIASTFMNTAIRMITQQIALRIAQQQTTMAYVVGKKTEVAAEIAAAKTKIKAHAATAGAGAMASKAAIPFVGPALGAAAMFAAIALVTGLIAKLNSGGVVPGSGPNRDSTMAMLTPGERVLTRDQNRTFETMVNNMDADQGPKRPVQGNTLVVNVASSANYNDVHQLEQLIEEKLGPAFFRLQKEGRIGSDLNFTRRV